MGGEGHWESGGELNNCGPQREGLSLKCCESGCLNTLRDPSSVWKLRVKSFLEEVLEISSKWRLR